MKYIAPTSTLQTNHNSFMQTINCVTSGSEEQNSVASDKINSVTSERLTKSNCQKRFSLGALLEVRTFKKCKAL